MTYRSMLMRSAGLALGAVLLFVLSGIIYSQNKARTVKGEHQSSERSFCSNNDSSNGEQVSFREVREMTLPSTGVLNIDGGKNGGIRVKGENRADVSVRACVQTWGVSDDAAKSSAASIRIGTGGVIKADGPEDSNWSVSYEVLVPAATNLDLTAHNGGISIGSVEGVLSFETTNGGVNLYDVAGDVRGRTTNGGLNISLVGPSFKGSGLDVTTTNGGVNLTIPESYSANIETGTVNGGFKSDIPTLNITTEDIRGDEYGRSRTKRIRTSLNGGGAPVRVITTNGGIKINSAERSR